MRAGPLRHPVTLQRPTGVQNAVGERAVVWVDVVSVRAAIEPLRVQERFLAAQAHGSATHRVLIRYSADVAALDYSWRVQYGLRVFTLEGPPRNIREGGVMLELICVEGLTDGFPAAGLLAESGEFLATEAGAFLVQE